jgi:hypothetical protein
MDLEDLEKRQGRSKRQYKNNSIAAFISVIGLILTIVIAAICNN